MLCPDNFHLISPMSLSKQGWERNQELKLILLAPQSNINEILL